MRWEGRADSENILGNEQWVYMSKNSEFANDILDRPNKMLANDTLHAAARQALTTDEKQIT